MLRCSQRSLSMSAGVADLLAGYHVRHEIPIRWGDMDAMQHVNNAMYFTYFEVARTSYFTQMDERYHTAVLKPGRGPGIILAESSCQYKFPLAWPDEAIVGVRSGEVGATDFWQEYRVVSAAHERIAAEGVARIVMYDYRIGKKCPVPEEVKEALKGMGNSSL